MSQPVTFFFGQHRLERFVFSPEDSHHLVRVLRFGSGDRVWGIDGSGTAFEVELEQANPRAASGRIVCAHLNFNEPRHAVVLIQGAIRPTRMDWLIEKATELGVTEVWPIAGRPPVGPGRLRRWQRIARSAAKQCLRGRIPLVTAPQSLEALVAVMPERADRILADPAGAEWPDPRALSRDLVLAVGPQEGFTEGEKGTLAELGFEPFSLGPRRLRAETAALRLLAWAALDRPARSASAEIS